MNEFTKVSAALMTPVLAIIATYIAWQQWRTNQLKVRHDLYERRFAIFVALLDFLSLLILQGTKIEGSALDKFFNKTSESCFLFGKEIPDYLDEAYNNAFKLHVMGAKLSTNNPPTGEKLDQLQSEKNQIAEWIIKELKTGAREKFTKYLKLY